MLRHWSGSGAPYDNSQVTSTPRRNLPLRIGIAGAGFAARFHHESMPELWCTLTGISSPRAESRERFAAAHNCTAYPSVEAMLGDVDVLDVCSPPSSHEPYVRMAAARGVDVIVEKPLTGFFGSPQTNTRQQMLDQVQRELAELRDVVHTAGILFGYAENYIYAPAIQEERRLIEASKAQILRMVAEESHSGSHAPTYGDWSQQGGGALFVKGCHPLGGVLYLKRKEGMARNGRPILPVSVSARTHTITKIDGFEDRGYLRKDYLDAEDFGFVHVVFEDGTVADVMASDLALGGVYDYVEVFANNHRTRCKISPVSVVDLYSPSHQEFAGLQLMEKVTTNEGWIAVSPEQNWARGFKQEMLDFCQAFHSGRTPECDLDLGIDITLTLYAAYVSADDHGREVKVPRI